MTEPRLVVGGASVAGLHAVQSARKTGPVTLLGAEKHLPCNRPPLSKAFLAEGPAPAPTTFPDAASLTDPTVRVRLVCAATGLDTAARHVITGGERIDYTSLIVATGSRARTLPIDQLPGVHTLRTVPSAPGSSGPKSPPPPADVNDPSMIEAAPLPLTRAVGPQTAAACATLHTRHGTDLRCGLTVTALTGTDRVEQVHLSDGTVLDADLVVVGIGAEPVVEWLTDPGLTLADGVVCEATLKAANSVYAVGDIARWHHPYQAVPNFWSDWYAGKISMVGICAADERRDRRPHRLARMARPLPTGASSARSTSGRYPCRFRPVACPRKATGMRRLTSGGVE